MSKIKMSWGFIKREYRGCFENIYFQIVVILQIIIVMLSLCRFTARYRYKISQFSQWFTNADYKCKWRLSSNHNWLLAVVRH